VRTYAWGVPATSLGTARGPVRRRPGASMATAWRRRASGAAGARWAASGSGRERPASRRSSASAAPAWVWAAPLHLGK
jgi:hypothetical protein